jgi:hypothetical protein
MHTKMLISASALTFLTPQNAVVASSYYLKAETMAEHQAMVKWLKAAS